MKFSVERKIIGGFGVALLLLGLSSGFAWWNATRFIQVAKQAAQSQQVLTELEALMSELKDAETGQRGYMRR